MRTVDVIVTLLAATDKLVLVSLHGDRDNAVWLHRDAISIAGLIESDHNCIITLPAQLARKKKLTSMFRVLATRIPCTRRPDGPGGECITTLLLPWKDGACGTLFGNT
jgi:hypothetical protein